MERTTNEVRREIRKVRHKGERPIYWVMSVSYTHLMAEFLPDWKCNQRYSNRPEAGFSFVCQ